MQKRTSEQTGVSFNSTQNKQQKNKTKTQNKSEKPQREKA